MLKVEIDEVDFLMAAMDKVMIPASASLKISLLINKLIKEKESLAKREAKQIKSV